MHFSQIFENLDSKQQSLFILSVLHKIRYSDQNLLQLLLDSCLKNLLKSPNLYRYSDTMDEIAFLIWYYTQGVGYRFLSINLPGILPSDSSLARTKHSITPFPLGFSVDTMKAAKTYYTSVGYSSMMFSLSEDSTSIIPGVQWSEKNNNIIGIITSTGHYTSSADTYEQIKLCVENSTFACDIHVYLLVPIFSSLPSFVIGVFPSNKTEKAINLLQRWEEVDKIANDLNIIIINHSSDGEAKQLRAMKEFRSNSLINNSWGFSSFSIPTKIINQITYPQCCFQDMVHIGTKLRNNLVGCRLLQIGSSDINLHSIKKLLAENGELKIGVRPSDLEPLDKMNFPAVERLCSQSAQKAVQNVKDFPLLLYLKLMQYSVLSFTSTDEKISLQERVKQMSYAATLSITWRNLNNAKNRLTSNQIQCICLNFVNFVGLISFLHHNFPMLKFHPSLLGSQKNEHLFRTLRMMHGMFSLGFNFTLRDVLYKIKTVEQVMLLESKYLNILKFPSHDKHYDTKISVGFHCEMITNDVLQSAINDGIKELKLDLKNILNIDETEIMSIINFSKVLELTKNSIIKEMCIEHIIDEEINEEIDEEIDIDQLKIQAKINIDITEISDFNKQTLTSKQLKAFVTYNNQNISKHKLCSILSFHAKIPLDRIYRVRGINSFISHYNNEDLPNTPSIINSSDNEDFKYNDEISEDSEVEINDLPTNIEHQINSIENDILPEIKDIPNGQQEIEKIISTKIPKRNSKGVTLYLVQFKDKTFLNQWITKKQLMENGNSSFLLRQTDPLFYNK